ncbi:MAG: hypothetical protein K5768_01375, partial [Firmicutes bacterium]|nr:hypothetical protein [Bacillota bacterium]
MKKIKLIRIIILIALTAGNQAYSPTVKKKDNTAVSFTYCERDEIRRLKESKQENVQSECEFVQTPELPKNEPAKKQTKTNLKATTQVKQNTTQNNQSTDNKVYIDGFGYVEPAEM